MPAIVTTLGQRCTVYLDADGVQRFKIDSSIDAVLAGDLPIYGVSPYTSNIFVHQVTDPNNPKADTFLRVANVVDLTTLAQGRETAVGRNQTVYLASTFTVTYDNIASATQAKTLIQQRVDNLIADWHKYNDEFLAPLNAPAVPPYTYSDISLPLTLSEETARKTAYYTAHSEYLASKTANVTAQAAYAIAAAAATAANDAAVKAVADSQKCSNLLGQFNGAKAGYDAYRTTMNALTNTVNNQAFVNASATFSAACTTFAAAAATYISYGTSPTGGQLTTFTNAKNAFVAAQGVWDPIRTSFTADATNAVAAMNTDTAVTNPQFTTFNTNLSQACTAKIADVQIAATTKTTADTSVATATTAKKVADEAEAAALIKDSLTFLSVKELCPDFEHLVP